MPLDKELLTGKDILRTAEEVIDGGTSIIQLRDKTSDKKELITSE